MQRLVLVLLMSLVLAACGDDSTSDLDAEAVKRIAATVSGDGSGNVSCEGSSSRACLRLMGLGLTQLPAEIGELTILQELQLGGNRLTSLPAEIGQRTNLEKLNLWRNQLTSLPPEIGQLTNLRELYLRDNRLTTLPPEIGQLTKLESLDLRNNQLTSLPPEIEQLPKLEILYLVGNTSLDATSLALVQRLKARGVNVLGP